MAAGVAAPALWGDIQTAAAHGRPYYVYTLSDADGVFYVGKGKGRRVFHHERVKTDRNGAKLARIARCGGEPTKEILAFFSDEGSAFACERDLIRESRETLTNMAGGVVDAAAVSKARAQSMLDRMLPLDRWKASLAGRPDVVRLAVSVAGSLDALYATLRRAVEKQAADPSPVSIFVPWPEVTHGCS